MKKGLSWFALLVMLMLGSAHAQPGKVTYVYTDAQGTPIAEADANGNITATFDYRPYGRQALGSPPVGPGYTGHVNDPDTGLIYMQARYYDVSSGHFLSPDPIAPSTGNLFNFGRYVYANNNPVLNVDPDGRQTLPPSVYTIDWTKPETRDAFKEYAANIGGLAPGIGDAQNIYEALHDPSPLTISVAIIGAVPEVGGVAAKAIKEANGATKAAGIVAKDGTKITGLTKHGVDRVIGDGGKRAGTKPTAILDALKNPSKVKEGVDSQGRAFKVYTGEKARVVVNPDNGKIISTNPLSREGAH